MLRARIGKMIPQPVFNRILLQFPFLYNTKFINYESYLSDAGITDLVQQVSLTLGLPGNIIECGSARCGTSTIIAKILVSHGLKKKIFSLDSFGEGFDLSELKDEKEKGLTDASEKAFTYNSYDYVMKKIGKLGYDDVIMPIKGFFKNTLPGIDSNFCLSFIDCDLTKSIEYCAETIWPNIVPCGIMLFDDYGFDNFRGVRGLVDNFVARHYTEIKDHGLMRRLYFVRKN